MSTVDFVAYCFYLLWGQLNGSKAHLNMLKRKVFGIILYLGLLGLTLDFCLDNFKAYLSARTYYTPSQQPTTLFWFTYFNCLLECRKEAFWQDDDSGNRFYHWSKSIWKGTTNCYSSWKWVCQKPIQPQHTLEWIASNQKISSTSFMQQKWRVRPIQ